MKLNYRLELTIRGIEDKIFLSFHGTEWQANKAFVGLKVALRESMFERVELQVVGKKNGLEIPVTLKRVTYGG